MSDRIKRLLLAGAVLATGAYITVQAAATLSSRPIVFADGNRPPPTKVAAPDAHR